MKLSPEAKKLFFKIHHEYESQGSTIRGDNEYIHALSDLQQRIFKGDDIVQIQVEFERLINESL